MVLHLTFDTHLLDKLQKNNGYVLLFDKQLQLKQIDVHVRFLDPTTNKVTTHYLDSSLMGHGTAKDRLSHYRVDR